MQTTVFCARGLIGLLSYHWPLKNVARDHCCHGNEYRAVLPLQAIKTVSLWLVEMDWVRCNSCFFQLTPRGNGSLYLTSCGHLTCSNCCTKSRSIIPSEQRVADSLPACLICTKPCSLAQLGREAQLSKDIMFYFTDPLSVLTKLRQAVEFQKMNYDNQMDYQQRRKTLDDINKAQEYFKCLSFAQSQFERNRPRLLQALAAIRQKAGSVGVQSKAPHNPPQSPITTNQNSVHPPMDTDPPSLPPSSQTRELQAGRMNQQRLPINSFHSHAHNVGGSGVLPDSSRTLRKTSSSITPRGLLSSAVITPRGTVEPGLRPLPQLDRQKTLANSAPHGQGPRNENVLTYGQSSGVQAQHRGGRVGQGYGENGPNLHAPMNVRSQLQAQRQIVPTQRPNVSTHTQAGNLCTPSLLTMPRQKEGRGSLRFIPNLTSHQGLVREIPNVSQLLTH